MTRDPVHLRELWSPVTERHRHLLVSRVNDHDLKVAINHDASEWHSHPRSDELFLTLEGTLRVEFRDGPAVDLPAMAALLVPAGVVHRTIPAGRAVNLLFERSNITTTFGERGQPDRAGSGAMKARGDPEAGAGNRTAV